MKLVNNFPPPPQQTIPMPVFSDAVLIEIMDAAGKCRQIALMLNGADDWFGYAEPFTKIEEITALLGGLLRSDDTIIGYKPTRYTVEGGRLIKRTSWCPVSVCEGVKFGYDDI